MGTGKQFHLLRSTFAVNQARKGVPWQELMYTMGHSNPQTSMLYINLARAAGVEH